MTLTNSIMRVRKLLLKYLFLSMDMRMTYLTCGDATISDVSKITPQGAMLVLMMEDQCSVRRSAHVNQQSERQLKIALELNSAQCIHPDQNQH